MSCRAAARQNDLGDDGAEALSVGLKQNKSLTSATKLMHEAMPLKLR